MEDYSERTEREEQLGVSWRARQVGLHKWPTSYIAMDLETTGLNPQTDGIVEIAGIKVLNGVVVDEFQSLVSPAVPLSTTASEVNGITEDMLCGAPATKDALAAFVAFSDGLPMLGHNAKGFDMHFLERACEEAGGITPPREWYDTMELASIVFGRKKISLKNLCHRCRVTNGKAHRALSDAEATHKCYQVLRGIVALVTTDARDFPPPPPQGPLRGEVICFTGQCRQMTRHELMESAVKAGAKLSNNVTLRVTTVVDVEGRDSCKVAKAHEYASRTGIRIIDANEYFSLIGVPLMPGIETNTPDDAEDDEDEILEMWEESLSHEEVVPLADASDLNGARPSAASPVTAIPPTPHKGDVRRRDVVDVSLTTIVVVFALAVVLDAIKAQPLALMEAILGFALLVVRNRRRCRLG